MSRIAEAAFGDKPYPERPGFKEPTTSKAAARAVAGTADGLRADAMAEIVAAGASGLTADEVAGRLGLSVLAVRPRVSELSQSGRVVRTGERRSNASGLKASVWRRA